MPFQVRTETRPCRADLDGTVYVLETPSGSRTEVWPALGFNCLSWRAPHRGQLTELLWADPQVWANPVPTRSGVPILFPFPNRIRAGRFTWGGKEYALPINDPQERNASHGFVCSRPWRIVSAGAATADSGEACACLQGEFHSATDAPDARRLWPADYALTATYLLFEDELSLHVEVRNPDTVPLPFGFGLHPYFRLPADRAVIKLPLSADSLVRWVLEDCLPTGEQRPLEGKDRVLVEPGLSAPAPGTHWDEAYRLTGPTGRGLEGWLIDPAADLAIGCRTLGGFRDVVLFTPPHREAVCLEPYTCVTDAINLCTRRDDTGLRVLPPGGTWRGAVTWWRATTAEYAQGEA